MSATMSAGASEALAMSAVASRKKCPVSWMKVERSAARSRLMTLGVWVMS